MGQSLRMKRFLYQLSWLLVLGLLFLMLFGSMVTPYPSDHMQTVGLVQQKINGVMTYSWPPFPPSAEHWLGTDHRGFDLVTMLFNGSSYTLGYALGTTALRFVLAVPLGLLVGATGWGKRLLSILQLSCTAVPPLLIVFPVMYGLNHLLPPDQTEPYLLILLVIVGVFPVAHQISERAAFFNDKPFVLAARSMGASPLQIIRVHLLPHLNADLLYAFLTEMVQVLFLFGQLAIVHIFLGGSNTVTLSDAVIHGSAAETLRVSVTGEWCAMIAYGVQQFNSYPWIALGAGAFLCAAILILIFFAKQMQQRLQHPQFYQIKPFVENKRRLWLVGLVCVGLLAILVWDTGKHLMQTDPVDTQSTPDLQDGP